MQSTSLKLRHYTLMISGLILVLFQSCKDDVDPEKSEDKKNNYEHFTGNYFCTIQYQRYYEGGGNEEYAINDFNSVIEVAVEDDTIHILDHKLPINGVDQRTFEVPGTDPRNILELTYSQHLDSIRLAYYSSTISGPSYSNTISGVRTNKPVTRIPESYSDLTGNYKLDITMGSSKPGSDTTFSVVLPVSLGADRIAIGSSEFLISPFYSYDQREDGFLNVSGSVVRRQSLYWFADSLHLDTEAIDMATNDTLKTTFNGVKQ